MRQRQITLIDSLIGHLDQGLRNSFPTDEVAPEPLPGDVASDRGLNESERQHAVRLMRVNHTGEVCAQALYRGQALTSREPAQRAAMLEAAKEETIHLQWCDQRLRELQGRPSYLNAIWYLGSLVIGSVAGLAGDRWNLGFLAETEHQVVRHLEGHLALLPEADQRSRAIVTHMQIDEARHASSALERGGLVLPVWVRTLMAWQSKLMTTIAYRI